HLAGDQLEIAALEKAFRAGTADRQFCSMGTVKSNIGHAEAASGITQLVKVVLQLRHRTLVPLITVDADGPHVTTESPFYLQLTCEPWTRRHIDIDGEVHEWPLRALIDSFGAAGQFVSVVVEEYEGVHRAIR